MSCFASTIGILERARRSRAILRAAAGVVAVPELLFSSVDAVPTPYAVLEYVDAISLRELKASGDREAVAQAAYDVGLHVAAIASIEIGPEVIGVPDIDPALLSGSNVNARLIEHFAASRLFRQRLSDAGADAVCDFAWRREAQLAPYAATASMAHGDFNSPNILVAQRDGTWRVAAILDWEFAFLGHTFYDIGNFLRYEPANC